MTGIMTHIFNFFLIVLLSLITTHCKEVKRKAGLCPQISEQVIFNSTVPMGITALQLPDYFQGRKVRAASCLAR